MTTVAPIRMPSRDMVALLNRGKEGMNQVDLGREAARILRNAEPAKDPVFFESKSTAIVRETRAVPGAVNADRLVRGTHSSSEQDLYGTKMTLQALTKMRDQASNNMTIFMNHKYDVPENVFGSVIQGELLQRNAFIDMDLIVEAVAEHTNHRVDKSLSLIGQHVKLGFSIGAFILDWEWQDKDGNTLEDYDPWVDEWEDGNCVAILDVLLVESSLVGVPANRRSWVQNGLDWQALRALRQAHVLPVVERKGNTMARKQAASTLPRLTPHEPATGGTNEEATRADTRIGGEPANAGAERDADPASVSVSNDPPAAGAGSPAAAPATQPAYPNVRGGARSDDDPAERSGQYGYSAYGSGAGGEEDDIDALEAQLYGPKENHPAASVDAARPRAVQPAPALAGAAPDLRDILAALGVNSGAVQAQRVTPELATREAGTLETAIAAGRAVAQDILRAVAQLGDSVRSMNEQHEQMKSTMAEAAKLGIYRPTNRQAADTKTTRTSLNDVDVVMLSDEELMAYYAEQRGEEGLD